MKSAVALRAPSSTSRVRRAIGAMTASARLLSHSAVVAWGRAGHPKDFDRVENGPGVRAASSKRRDNYVAVRTPAQSDEQAAHVRCLGQAVLTSAHTTRQSVRRSAV